MCVCTIGFGNQVISIVINIFARTENTSSTKRVRHLRLRNQKHYAAQPTGHAVQTDADNQILRKGLGKTGKSTKVRYAGLCEFPKNIFVGAILINLLLLSSNLVPRAF